MDAVRELIANIVYIVIPLIPLVLILIARKRISGRKTRSGGGIKKTGEMAFRDRAVNLPSPTTIPAPAHDSATPFYKVSNHQTIRNQSISNYYSQKPSQTPAKNRTASTPPSQPHSHPLSAISRYPVGMQAVLLGEIIGRPKGTPGK